MQKLQLAKPIITEASDSVEMTVWVTSPGKASRPAKVMAKLEGI